MNMAFHFTLEAVLRFRQSLEDRELLRLQTLLVRRSALLHDLEQLRQASLNLQAETKRAMLPRPMPAVEIHFAMARLHGLERQQQVIREQLHELEGAIREQRSRFERERRNCEALEALRDAQLRDYRLAQRRREQVRLDELHLLRRAAAIRSDLPSAIGKPCLEAPPVPPKDIPNSSAKARSACDLAPSPPLNFSFRAPAVGSRTATPVAVRSIENLERFHYSRRCQPASNCCAD